MKTIHKYLITNLMVVGSFATLQAQETAEAQVPKVAKAIAINETVIPAIQGKEIVITFKNTCDRPVAIFAGPKENLREPRLQTFGGLSTNNKLYVKENEVVCLMTEDKKPKACVILKPGILVVEVNVSANGISGK